MVVHVVRADEPGLSGSAPAMTTDLDCPKTVDKTLPATVIELPVGVGASGPLTMVAEYFKAAGAGGDAQVNRALVASRPRVSHSTTSGPSESAVVVADRHLLVTTDYPRMALGPTQ